MGKVYIKAKQQFFKPGEAQMYFTKSITYSKIGFDVLVKHVSADSGMSEAACEGAIRSIMKQVEEMVLNGHTIYIKQLGIYQSCFCDPEEVFCKRFYISVAVFGYIGTACCCNIPKTFCSA